MAAPTLPRLIELQLPFAGQEEGPGVAAHTPRRTALKWEPLHTEREEPLALSRKTEAYCPVCRGSRGSESAWILQACRGVPDPTGSSPHFPGPFGPT